MSTSFKKGVLYLDLDNKSQHITTDNLIPMVSEGESFRTTYYFAFHDKENSNVVVLNDRTYDDGYLYRYESETLNKKIVSILKTGYDLYIFTEDEVYISKYLFQYIFPGQVEPVAKYKIKN